MIRNITAVAVSALVGLGVAASPAHAGPSYEQQVITLINQQRAANGCGGLAENANLDKAAAAHTQEMASTDNMSHDGANGSTVGDRLSQAGYPATKWAENIAYGQRTPQEVVDAWMASEGHRANIVNCELAETGVGYALNKDGVPYWTQDFGSR